MKTISPARLAYLAGGALTEARLWRVVRNDGRVYTYTSADIDLIKDGERYAAETGFTSSAVGNSASLAVDNLEVSGFLNAASITEADISAGLWDKATIFVVDVNYTNVPQGQTIVASGFVGNISAGRLGFTVECRSLSQLLAQNIGRTVTAACDADVFDARCGLNPALYIVTGSVTGGNTDNKHFADSTRTEADAWFDFGKVTWITGANAGLSLSQEIKSQVGTDFVLQLRLPYPIAIGDTYSMLPGCNKLLKAPGDVPPAPYTGHCRVKFLIGTPQGNAVHFRGHPEVPGINRTVGEANAP